VAKHEEMDPENPHRAVERFYYGTDNENWPLMEKPGEPGTPTGHPISMIQSIIPKGTWNWPSRFSTSGARLATSFGGT